ncbi:AbiTii domain-containing protein [Agrobacterium sp. Azo12]|uniref:AbiTii domain-containing protein n=1 Tax=Agrobacterium sp. Azo12 TaxID=3031129 RepID=UPI0023D861FC|nr:hypothetical protein [Agrobacterium sp. Azo12]MDO5896545.1 hypothetical protein [Agrobacterium sp. Azo12]
MIQDIIRSLSETKDPVSDILRKTLVLTYRMKNEQLRTWVEKELNGYSTTDELPSYRQAVGTAKGVFLGGFGQQINNQPLASGVLKPEHRHWAREIRLRQPIIAYEGKDPSMSAALEWPADLVVLYQEKFYDDFALNRAWLEIPGTIIQGAVDTVRTRLLMFMLEIESESPGNEDVSVAQIPPTTVDRILHVTIMGGNNVIGPVNEFNSTTVVAGDFGSLQGALHTLGVDADQLASLEAALSEDKLLYVDQGKPKTVGKKTLEWIGHAAKATGKKGLEVGGAVMEEAIKRAVFGYLGYS